MTRMGMATLNDHRFRLDPTSITWSYSIKARDFKAVGGKVVQVFGATINDMTVVGSFGKGGWEEQESFLAKMSSLAKSQTQTRSSISAPVKDAPPLRFRYPPRNWDFLVYLTGFQQPGASSSVMLTNETFAPQWQLTFAVIEDNAGLRQVAMDQYLSRLAQGLGWKQTDYNGPMDQTSMMSLVGGNMGTYLSQYYGLNPGGGSAAADGPQAQ